MRNRLLSILAVTALAVTVAGCEGRTSGFITTGSTGDVQVRVLNALTPSQAVDFLVDGRAAGSNIGLGQSSSYVTVTLGAHRLQVRSVTSGTILVDLTRDLSTPGAFSVVPAPGLLQSGALFLTDDLASVAGQTRLRVVHAAAAPGPVSVYVTDLTADLGSATPVLALLESGTASAYFSIPAGSYRIRVTRAGSPGDVLLDTGGVPLAGGTVRTLLLTDAASGGLPTAVSIITDAN